MHEVNVKFKFESSHVGEIICANSWDVYEVDHNGKDVYVTVIQYFPAKDKFISAFQMSPYSLSSIVNHIRNNNLMEKI